jgi:hypothetical protein
MIEYRIISTDKSDNFSEIVTKYIQQVWELHGDPFFANGAFCQAITKK